MQLATDFAIETIAKHPIQGHFAAVLVHQKTNAMVCSAPPASPPHRFCGSVHGHRGTNSPSTRARGVFVAN